MLDVDAVMVEPWEPRDLPRKPKFDRGFSGQILRMMAAGRRLPHWDLYLAHDFGVSAPSVTYVVGESPGTAP